MENSEKPKENYIYNERFIEKDIKLNRTIVDVTYFSVIGWGTGLIASVFFKNKSRIRNFGLGFGAGYGSYRNCKKEIKVVFKN